MAASPVILVSALLPLAALPEADAWAMLLAGLGLVGISARRRKQRHI